MSIMEELLRSETKWLILSNAESGDGFSDILIEPEDSDAGIVIEIKYASSIARLDIACEKVLTYNIVLCKKCCKVVCEKQR